MYACFFLPQAQVMHCHGDEHKIRSALGATTWILSCLEPPLLVMLMKGRETNIAPVDAFMEAHTLRDTKLQQAERGRGGRRGGDNKHSRVFRLRRGRTVHAGTSPDLGWAQLARPWQGLPTCPRGSSRCCGSCRMHGLPSGGTSSTEELRVSSQKLAVGPCTSALQKKGSESRCIDARGSQPKAEAQRERKGKGRTPGRGPSPHQMTGKDDSHTSPVA